MYFWDLISSEIHSLFFSNLKNEKHQLKVTAQGKLPFTPSSLFCLHPFCFLAVVPGPFRITCLAPNFWTLGAKRRRSQRVKVVSLSSASSRPLIYTSSAGVCHPPLSQTDVCLPVYCSWPGRLVGVPASALSLTL